MQPESPRWSVLVRAECSLCDTLLMELAQVLPPAQAALVAVVDVDGDEHLRSKYGHRVPVLLIDDEFVCDYRLDESRVRAYLD